MTVSIIIVNYNGCEYTRQCLESIRQVIGVSAADVIVVDNNSTDASKSVLPGLFPSVRFLWLNSNNGFGYANNRGAEVASGNIVFFLNNDTILTENILGPIVRTFSEWENPGIVGPKLLNADRSLQTSAGKFPTIVNEWKTKNASAEPTVDNPDWVTGAALAMRKDLFNAVGGFDEGYFMYFEDIDLCRRVKGRGLSIRYLSEVSLIHLGGKSYDTHNTSIPVEYRRSQLRYYDRHCSLFQRIAVRLYLLMKYSLWLFSRSKRSRAAEILRLIFAAPSIPEESI